MKYYKFMNGTRSSEYNVSEYLYNIESLLAKDSNDMLCGVFSAIMSEYIVANSLIDVKNKTIIFVTLMYLLYLALRVASKLIKRFLIFFNEMIRREIVTDNDEISMKRFLYDRVANEVIYGISLINKVKKIQNKNITKKEELCYIYLLQAKNSFVQTYDMLYNALLSKTKIQIDKCVESIGVDILEWICENAKKSLEEINRIDSRIDVEYQIIAWEKIQKDIRC